MKFVWQNLNMKIIAIVATLSVSALGAPQYPWNEIQLTQPGNPLLFHTDSSIQIAQSDMRADQDAPGNLESPDRPQNSLEPINPPHNRPAELSVSRITFVTLFLWSFQQGAPLVQ